VQTSDLHYPPQAYPPQAQSSAGIYLQQSIFQFDNWMGAAFALDPIPRIGSKAQALEPWHSGTSRLG
jgi:hypothetical protein